MARQRSLRAVGYQHMLFIIVIAYVLIIAVPAPAVGGPIRVAVLGLLLTVAVRSRRRTVGWVLPSIAVGVALVIATAVAATKGSQDALVATASAATAALVVAVMYLIVQSLLANKVIDNPAVRAVLCIYLLLALLFASLFQFFALWVHPMLNGASDPPTASQALYFSVITLATIGYGDIVPVNNLARALVVGEAIIGQLYLVSVVAVVVGQYRHDGPKPPPPE